MDHGVRCRLVRAYTLTYANAMGLVISGLTFDLLTFDRQLRKQMPEVVSYDMTMPRYGTSVDLRVYRQNGSSAKISVSGDTLVAWGAYT